MQQTEARVRRMLEELDAGLYERDEAVAICLLAALSGKPAFLYGPPGTAKSMIARRVASAFSGSSCFEHLMQRFSTPEDVFGPVSISALKEDRYERKTEGYLPSADIAFLDEIWKAGPAILNTLLTIINERTFRNGTETAKVPLKALFAASNELPPEGSGLAALYDRFTVRVRVGPLSSDADFAAMLENRGPEACVSHPFSNEEWTEIREKSSGLPIGKAAMSAILNIRGRLKGVYVSDRRWKQSADLLRTAAWVCGKNEVTAAEVPILRCCLWSSEEDIGAVDEAVRGALLSSEDFPLARFESWKKRFGDAEKRAEESVIRPAKECSEYRALPMFGGRRCVPLDAGGIVFYIPAEKIRTGNSVRADTDDPEVFEVFYITDMRDGTAAMVGGRALKNRMFEVHVPSDTPMPPKSSIEMCGEELAHLAEEASGIVSDAGSFVSSDISSPFAPDTGLKDAVLAYLSEMESAAMKAKKLSEKMHGLL